MGSVLAGQPEGARNRPYPPDRVWRFTRRHQAGSNSAADLRWYLQRSAWVGGESGASVDRKRVVGRWLAVVVPLLFASACGDSAGGDSAGGDKAAVSTTVSKSTTSAAPSGKLPEACGLIDDATAAAAMAGTATVTKTVPQPPTDVSSRCEWTGGSPYTLSLLVQRGTNAKSSFDNAVSGGFAAPAVTLAGTDLRVRLGAHETSRNYRLVSVAAYNGTYYVYFTIQGTDRTDAAATDIATGLVRDALKKLPT